MNNYDDEDDNIAACGVRLAAAGYGVFGMDYEGHGKSMGTRCYIRSFHRLVDDCDRFYKSICGNHTNGSFDNFAKLRKY